MVQLIGDIEMVGSLPDVYARRIGYKRLLLKYHPDKHSGSEAFKNVFVQLLELKPLCSLEDDS